ncbi:uncharacterized protein LOC117783511 [Drosophila innubila]|uniref:uncharacterized protein LOC117783511 n=1 Tax=Drosophila innubila TaxID=198719 RepID=UPI00148CE5A7|nr:uncharacterized protein LOC117783511 [Drosophila innubila]
MSKLLLICCIAVCCSASLVAGGRRNLWWYHMSTRPQVQVSYSPELVQDLHEFIDLIPTAVIDEVIAEHLIVDSGFRKAIKFLRSSDFKQLLQRIQMLPEVIEVINYLHLNETAVSTTLRVDKRFGTPWTLQNSIQHEYGYFLTDPSSSNSLQDGVVIVFLPDSQHNNKVDYNLGSFISFVQELLTHLPRDRFVNLINEKLKSGKVFPKFYEALRSDEFKPLIEKTMKSQNVINILSTLASHQIDANALKGIAFEVISWGPPV